MARPARLDPEGRCARCAPPQYHHCNGRVRACRCECTGAPVDVLHDDDARTLFGASGTHLGVTYVWCARCGAYHLMGLTHATRLGYAHVQRRVRWSSRIGAPTPFSDPDTGRVVVGAIVRDMPERTRDAALRALARSHADADASRDRHGATPTALPCIAPPRVSHDDDASATTRDVGKHLARMTTARERDDHARERDAWRRAFDARLASRDAR